MNVDPELLQQIADQVARVLPLVFRNWQYKGRVFGETVVRFRLSDQGYPYEMEVLQAEGDPRLYRESYNAIRLASPYPTPVAGWVELTLVFRG